jgi:hypothetical protein
MTIQRRYQPDPEALDCLVEALYRLLVDAPDGHAEDAAPAPSEARPSTCVSGESEQ